MMGLAARPTSKRWQPHVPPAWSRRSATDFEASTVASRSHAHPRRRLRVGSSSSPAPANWSEPIENLHGGSRGQRQRAQLVAHRSFQRLTRSGASRTSAGELVLHPGGVSSERKVSGGDGAWLAGSRDPVHVVELFRACRGDVCRGPKRVRPWRGRE